MRRNQSESCAAVGGEAIDEIRMETAARQLAGAACRNAQEVRRAVLERLDVPGENRGQQDRPALVRLVCLCQLSRMRLLVDAERSPFPEPIA